MQESYNPNAAELAQLEASEQESTRVINTWLGLMVLRAVLRSLETGFPEDTSVLQQGTLNMALSTLPPGLAPRLDFNDDILAFQEILKLREYWTLEEVQQDPWASRQFQAAEEQLLAAFGDAPFLTVLEVGNRVFNMLPDPDPFAILENGQVSIANYESLVFSQLRDRNLTDQYKYAEDLANGVDWVLSAFMFVCVILYLRSIFSSSSETTVQE